MKYRKKPITVDAVQFFPRGDDRHDPSMVVHRKGNSVDPPDFRQKGDLWLSCDSRKLGGHDIYLLRTRGGDVRVNSGDWIVTDPDTGYRWAVDDEAFQATYVLAAHKEQTDG